jgi:Cu2+-exporting ATPase
VHADLASRGWELALDHATALLIVACPCALALATPLVTAVAIGDSAKRGRLIKGADVFDRMRICKRFFLDKTGTVTLGRFEVQRVIGGRVGHPACSRRRA